MAKQGRPKRFLIDTWEATSDADPAHVGRAAAATIDQWPHARV